MLTSKDAFSYVFFVVDQSFGARSLKTFLLILPQQCEKHFSRSVLRYS